MTLSAIEKNRIKEDYNKINDTKSIQIHSIIKFIIISGWILLAGLTSYIIIFEYGYNNTSTKLTEIQWHIAITIFIIVLACSFFLQTLLIERENKNDLRNKIVHALNHEHRNYYLKKLKSNEKNSLDSLNVEKDNHIIVYHKKNRQYN